MEPGSQRTRFTGPALVRLLARLTASEVPDPPAAFAETLSRWLRWTDAVALSAALNGGPTAETGSPADAPGAVRAAERELARLRGGLARSIVEDGEPEPGPRGPDRRASPAAAPVEPPALDFTPYRLQVLARQQAMEAGVAGLRERLRATLAAASSQLARLAALDAAVEQALAAHERRLLAGVPVLLGRRFERLRRAQAAAATSVPTRDGAGSAAPPVPPHTPHRAPHDAWLATFRQDMHAVLLAELEVRLQPIEGLLAALRTRPPVTHG